MAKSEHGAKGVDLAWIVGVGDAALEREVAELLATARCAERRSPPLPPGLTRIQRGSIAALRFYQRSLSERLARTCIYEPSCSEYAVLAIAYDGTLIGVGEALRRWVRCRPGYRGGIDYPKGCDVPH